MKDYLDDTGSNTQNIREEIEAIKKDMESLMHRLGNIKNHSDGALQEQLDNLSTVISHVKDKAVSGGRDNLAELCFSTRRHPLRNLAYAFGLGCAFSYFMKK